MGDFPVGHYSKKTVVKAGKALRGQLQWPKEQPAPDPAIYEAFKIAYDWRDSHALPLRRIRAELAGRLKRLDVKGITAGRLKRMASIRKKLRRGTTTLLQIQDLGGCRAILDNMDDVNAVVAAYRNGASDHAVREDTSYIEQPKPGGYRSHHFVLDFQGDEDVAMYNGRRIEIQIRTQLQHIWATAVESIGLIRGEDFKAGEGDSDWLRLFELMASEFAYVEHCPVVPGTPEKVSERWSEIRALNSKFRAAGTLASMSRAFKVAGSVPRPNASYYLIEYDPEDRSVRVRGYPSVTSGSDNHSRDYSSNGVLVEIDKVENLKAAYPNYFLDITAFTENIFRIIEGRPETPFDIFKRVRGLDLSWVNKFKRR